jgi:hypothetical protein
MIRALALMACVLLPVLAAAQDGPALRPGHAMVDASLVWAGGYDVGSATAQLRGNAPGATAPPFTLLRADSRVTPASAALIRVGVALTRTVAIELSASRARPRIGVAISADAEAPVQQLPGETLQQYQFEGGLNWQLPIRAGRMVPFVSIGGGHLRQLHEDRTLAETGQVYYAGGGARYWLRGGTGASGPWPLGVRSDLRMTLRRKGIDFENTMRTYLSVSLALFIGL